MLETMEIRLEIMEPGQDLHIRIVNNPRGLNYYSTNLLWDPETHGYNAINHVKWYNDW